MEVQTCDEEEKFLAEEQTAKEGLAILENMFQMLVCGVLYLLEGQMTGSARCWRTQERKHKSITPRLATIYLF